MEYHERANPNAPRSSCRHDSQELRVQDEALEIRFEEGHLVLILVTDELGAFLDAASIQSFFQREDYWNQGVDDIPDTARIEVLVGVTTLCAGRTNKMGHGP